MRSCERNEVTRPAHRTARWAGRLLLGVPFGLWVLVALHLGTAGRGRTMTGQGLERKQTARRRLRRCYLSKRASGRRRLCEARVAAVGGKDPSKIVSRMIVVCLLCLCGALSLICSSLGALLSKRVAGGCRSAQKLAFGLVVVAGAATGVLLGSEIVFEATATGLIAQCLTASLVGLALIRGGVKAQASMSGCADRTEGSPAASAGADESELPVALPLAALRRSRS